MRNKDDPLVLDYYEVRNLKIDTSKLKKTRRFWIESIGFTCKGAQRRLERKLRKKISKSKADLFMIEGTGMDFGFPPGISYSIIEYGDPNNTLPRILEAA